MGDPGPTPTGLSPVSVSPLHTPHFLGEKSTPSQGNPNHTPPLPATSPERPHQLSGDTRHDMEGVLACDPTSEATQRT